MNLIPTWNEIKSFFKVNKKLIGISIVGFLTVFLALFGYNLLSSDSEILEPEYLSQEEVVEILEREPEDVSASELDQVKEALGHDRYTFKVLVEKESQEFMNNQAVLTNIMISEDVVSMIEERSGVAIEPEAIQSIGVASENDILRVVIGTADVADNEKIANAYYDVITNQELPFLEDKTVYAMDDEPFLEEEQSWFDLAGTQLAELSTTAIAVTIIGGIILSMIVAVLIAILKSVFQKKVPVSYKLEKDAKDKVVYLTKLASVSEEQYLNNLAFAIENPTSKKKLVLSQQVLPTKLSKKLSQKAVSGQQTKLTIADEVSNTNPSYTYDEVVILVKQNQTDKDWYKNQRIQIEKLDAPVTIVQY